MTYLGRGQTVANLKASTEIDFWSNQLKLYRDPCAVFSEFLVSGEYFGFSPDLYGRPNTGWAASPGPFAQPAAIQRGDQSTFHTGQPVSVADLPAAGRWPRFTAAAAEVGFAAVHALPMRLRTEVIGGLNFFDTNSGALPEGKLRIGQALADVATVGLLQQRAIHRRDVLTQQLQTALNSRVLIEQAKGILAERLHLDVADAFTLLRTDARNHNRRLSDLAQAIVDGTEQIPPTAASQAR